MENKFSELNNQTWDQILRNTPHKYQPPYTVHMPINPAGTPDFVHVDAALNVCRRRVYPGLSNREWDKYVEAGKKETFIVQFALDSPPVVPDFHQSKMHTAKGEYPIANASYWHRETFYELEYAVAPIAESRQSILVVSGKVTNESVEEKDATVRIKINFQRECDLFPYHYTPFSWNVSNWLPCDRVNVAGDEIMLDGGVIGRVLEGDMEIAWEDSACFEDSEYNTDFSCNNPHHVTEEYRLKNPKKLIRLTSTLKPNESCNFGIALLVDYENISEEDIQKLLNINAQAARRASIEHFKSLLPETAAELVFPSANWENIFESVQTSTLQLLVNFPDTNALTPTQGGSTERHMVWVWEAVCMLMPMLRLGYFEPVRRSLDFIFALQDSGYVPEGEFTTLKGAIGTTGPRWANSTASALALAADYYIYSNDTAFLDEYLPKILRAADWIVGEIRATRVMNPDGTRPQTYGIMPYATATDGDIGCVIAFTDAYSYWGLNKVARLLEVVGHERAAEIRSEVKQYKSDIEQAAQSVTREDGFIDRMISREGDTIYPKFNNTVGAVHLAYTDSIDIHTETFRKYETYSSENLADELFLGRMDREVLYMGVVEWVWQDVYLRLGDWKKAFAATRQNLLYGMTQDTFQVQERFSRFNPAFTPWQPNGSGNGKVLDTIIKSIYFESNDCAILLGGVPFAYLEDNQTTKLHNLHTPNGLVLIVAQYMEDKTVSLTVSSTGSLPAKLQIPNHYKVLECSGVQLVSECIYSVYNTREVRFLLSKGSD